jgi:thioredoxin-related protein
MKKIIFLTFVVFSISISAQEINWMTFNEALEAQKTTPKKIFVDTYTNWCGWCKKMDKETFTNTDVIDYLNKNYYAVKFNAEGNEVVNLKGKEYTNPNFISNKSGRNNTHELSQYFGIRSFPSVLFIDEEGDLIAPISGYKDPQDLELFLKFFELNDYKKVTTKKQWKKYSKKFKHKFKG